MTQPDLTSLETMSSEHRQEMVCVDAQSSNTSCLVSSSVDSTNPMPGEVASNSICAVIDGDSSNSVRLVGAGFGSVLWAGASGTEIQSCTTSTVLFSGAAIGEGTYICASGLGEEQEAVQCHHGNNAIVGSSILEHRKRLGTLGLGRISSIPPGGNYRGDDTNKKRKKARRQHWGACDSFPYPPRNHPRPPGSGSSRVPAAESAESAEMGELLDGANS